MGEKEEKMNLGVMGKTVGKSIYRVLKFYATVKEISMHDIYAKALIMYARHVWNNEFDSSDREYVKKKLKLDKKTIEILEGGNE